MSHPQFSGSPSGMLIELDDNTSKIWGNGGLNYPHMCWHVPIFISFHREQPNRYIFRSVTAQLYLNGAKIADARPLVLDRMVVKPQGKLTEYLGLEFPLTMQQICAFEDFRQGRSLKLQLWVQLHIDESRLVGNPGLQIWEFEGISMAQLQQDIEISQTQWVNQVLPRIGYGIVHVVEFPAASLAAFQGLEHSVRALEQAQEKHRLGFYDDAAGKCRLAIEPFFDYEPVDSTQANSKKVPTLKKSWEIKLGKTTYDWLKITLGSLKEASNRPHHSPNAHYSQFDSQMILAITTAVVAYIARTLKPEDLKS